jgi:predicted negative regulator of RcsB-dependent stress response
LTDYLTEQEQIQQLKTWIKQYGPTILASILIAVAVTSGWHYWQNYRNKILTHASAVYNEMLALRAQNNINGATIQAKKLISHYPKTPYAHMAALLIAREAVINKNYPEAITQLTWVINHSKDPSLREISRTRLSRIFIEENKPDEAIQLLTKLDDKNFIGLVDEIRGDAYLAKKDSASARKYYRSALDELPNAEEIRPILQMKYDNLATNN